MHITCHCQNVQRILASRQAGLPNKTESVEILWKPHYPHVGNLLEASRMRLSISGLRRSPSRHLAPKRVPTIPVGQDCSLSPACRRSGETRIVRQFLSAVPRGTRIVRQFFPAAPRGQESRRDTLPPSSLGQETVFLACRRTVWARKQCFYLPAALRGTRFARQFLPAARIS